METEGTTVKISSKNAVSKTLRGLGTVTVGHACTSGCDHAPQDYKDGQESVGTTSGDAGFPGLDSSAERGDTKKLSVNTARKVAMTHRWQEINGVPAEAPGHTPPTPLRNGASGK